MAGGTGRRFNSELPKQFVQVCGKPLIVHTLEAFLNAVPDIRFIIVINPKIKEEWSRLKKEFALPECILTDGGPKRFHSVKNGLAAIPDLHSLVAIHDAVRPFVATEVILNAFKDAGYYGNAVPVININETVRIRKGALNEPADRTCLFKVQTPQCFRTDLIRKAYMQNYDEKFTDDAIVLESAGEQIHLIDGNVENIKITYPTDLLIAEAFLKNRLAK